MIKNLRGFDVWTNQTLGKSEKLIQFIRYFETTKNMQVKNYHSCNVHSFLYPHEYFMTTLLKKKNIIII